MHALEVVESECFQICDMGMCCPSVGQQADGSYDSSRDHKGHMELGNFSIAAGFQLTKMLIHERTANNVPDKEPDV